MKYLLYLAVLVILASCFLMAMSPRQNAAKSLSITVNGGGAAGNSCGSQYGALDASYYSPGSPTGTTTSLWITDGMIKYKQNAANTVGSTKLATPCAAKNEWTEFQIHYKNTSGSTQTINAVTISDLTCNTGPNCGSTQTIAAATNVIVYREGYYNVQEVADSTIQVSGLLPDVLIPVVDPYHSQTTNALPYTIGASNPTTQSFWVDILVPSSVPSGYYNGTATIKDGSNATIATLPITLAVWNFSIPSKATLRNNYLFGGNEGCSGYYGGADNGASECSAYPPASGDANLAVKLVNLDAAYLLLDHRMSPGSSTTPRDDSSASPSFTAFDTDWLPLLKGTSTHTLLSGAAMNTFILNSQNNSNAQAWSTHFSANSIAANTLVDYHCDEPGTPATIDVGISRTSNVVTLVFSLGQDSNFAFASPGDPVQVVGVSDTSFNGTFTIASISVGSPNVTVTWNQTAADANPGASGYAAKRWGNCVVEAGIDQSASPIVSKLITTNIALNTQMGDLGITNLMDVNDFDMNNVFAPGDQRSTYNAWMAGGSGGHSTDLGGPILGMYESCTQHGSCNNGSSSVFPAGTSYPSSMVEDSPVRARMQTWIEYYDSATLDIEYDTAHCWIVSLNSQCQDGAGNSPPANTMDPWLYQYDFGGNGDGQYVYPGTSAKICPASCGSWIPVALPSIRLKLRRDGIQDYEYMYQLSGHPYSQSSFVTTQLGFITNIFTFPSDGSLVAARNAMGNKIHCLSLGAC